MADTANEAAPGSTEDQSGDQRKGRRQKRRSPAAGERRRFQVELCLSGDPGQRLALQRGEHGQPHDYLGCHAAKVGNEEGTVVRVYQPAASRVDLLLDAEGDTAAGSSRESATAPSATTPIEMMPVDLDIFAAWLPGRSPSSAYRFRFHDEDGTEWQRQDPYAFPQTLTEDDLYFASEGTHRRLWECLGAHPHEVDGVHGYAFSVWAPNARRVSLVGEFCAWDPRVLPLRRLGSSGIWELFVPGIESGTLYKFDILGPNGTVSKADPMARWAEAPPMTASRTFESSYSWADGAYMEKVAQRDPRKRPMAIYELHLGSWQGGGGGHQSYRDLAPALVDHVKERGFDHVELMPVAEHPYTGSWGYQITGYYAPTARYGTPDDFRYFVDYLHQHDIGVIVDWVPAHFVKDAHGLGRFDGTALYEHEDPRRGEHPDWGTYIFNYGRNEVRNFLVANALYWFEEFHIDGLRVDAVASMLYLDYSRKEGEWIPNHQGGRENYDAIALLRETNRLVHELYPGRFTVAEESTSWPGITKSPELGGLGFTFKWNMGWMHDTLNYFKLDPLYRAFHHDQLTFAMVYEYSEAFVNPLSHDEVVHGKGSLLDRMPGDPWRKLANLRALFVYLYTRPGKVLLFMGSEIAQAREWNHETGLDWFLRDDPGHADFEHFVGTLGKLYRQYPALWRQDHQPEGFRWINASDRDQSVFVYARFDEPAPDAADAEHEDRSPVVVALNLTPVPREGYRIGVPLPGKYRVVLDSDDEAFGGSGYPRSDAIETEPLARDGFDQSLSLTLTPLAGLMLVPTGDG